MSWLFSLFSSNYPLIPVKSNVDGKEYRVRDMPDKQFAADLLAKLRIKLTDLTNYLEQKFPDKQQVKMMVSNFRSDPNRFIEATPDATHTSYSINKGQEIHLCLRQRSGANENIVDDNVTLKADEFRKLVEDNWDWSEQWFTSNSNYSNSVAVTGSAKFNK